MSEGVYQHAWLSIPLVLVLKSSWIHSSNVWSIVFVDVDVFRGSRLWFLQRNLFWWVLFYLTRSHDAYASSSPSIVHGQHQTIAWHSPSSVLPLDLTCEQPFTSEQFSRDGMARNRFHHVIILKVLSMSSWLPLFPFSIVLISCATLIIRAHKCCLWFMRRLKKNNGTYFSPHGESNG